MHPNIVNIVAHKFLSTERIYMLLMEYCIQGDLTGIFEKDSASITA